MLVIRVHSWEPSTPLTQAEKFWLWFEPLKRIDVICCFLGPMFLLDGLLGTIFLIPCKCHSKRIVFNPADPGRWYVVDGEDNVVPDEEDVEVENVTIYKCLALFPAMFGILLVSYMFLVVVMEHNIRRLI